MRADDDQLCVERVRAGDDLVDGHPGQQIGPCDDTLGRRESRRVFERRSLAFPDLVRHHSGHREAGHRDDVDRRHDLDDDHFGVEVGCQLDAELDGCLRRG